MEFTIAQGQTVEIYVGSKIKCAPSFIPPQFEDQYLDVTKIEAGYPYVRFKGEGIDEESAVSPEIIIEVL